MKWIRPTDQLPPQGKKILYFKNGDIYVVQRFAELWLPIPFYDSVFAFYDEPELWCDIEPPENYTGKVFVKSPKDKDGNLMTIDELEIRYPKEYKKLIEIKKDFWEKICKEMFR
jgi:hypothetical protein